MKRLGQVRILLALMVLVASGFGDVTVGGGTVAEAADRCRPIARRGCRRHRIARCRPRCFSQPRFSLPRQAPVESDVEPGIQSLFDGRSLAGWRVENEADFTSHGEVVVRDGRIHLGMGNPATGVVRTSDVPKINYEVSLEAMRTGGGDFFCGLTFPVRDQFCTLIVGGWGGGVVGLSNIDGVPANDNAVASWQDFDDDRWYRIRLRVTEAKIEAWIDDRRLIEVDTDEHNYDIWWEQEPMRPLGIATWYTSAALRNIKIEKIAQVEASL